MKSAVEWLLKILEGQKDKPFNYEEWLIAFNHAKEMEKQQIYETCADWWNEGASYVYDGKRSYLSFEQYYNEKFKK